MPAAKRAGARLRSGLGSLFPPEAMTPFTIHLHEAIQRRVADAATRFKHIASGLYQLHQQDGQTAPARELLGMEAEALLWNILDDAEYLVPVCRDDAEWDTLQKAADTIRSAVRARRLAVALAATEGRTPEEKAAYEAAARRLGGNPR